MRKEATDAVVRILNAEESALHGCGVFIGREWVLTCTHVVAPAVKALETGPAPKGARLRIDFPLRDNFYRADAEVVDWTPVQYARNATIPNAPTEDIAVLRVLQPPPETDLAVEFAHSSRDLINHPFEVWGLPGEPPMPQGRHARGTINNAGSGGWIQLDCVGSVAVQRGFSGSPVWDAEEDAFVGLVVEFDLRPTQAASFMISASVLASVFRSLPIAFPTDETNEERDIPHLLVHSCDRGDQERALRNALKTTRTSTQPIPIIVHGPEDECHPEFLERLESEYLPTLLKLPKNVIIRPVELDAPTIDPHLSPADIENHIRVSLDADGWLNADSTPIAFHHYIRTSQWLEGTDAFIRGFANYWANVELSAQRTVITILAVQYAKTRGFIERLRVGRINRRIERMLLGWERASDGPITLPPLKGADQEDVARWVRSDRVRKVRYIKSKEIRAIFDGASERISMEELAEHLENLLLRRQRAA